MALPDFGRACECNAGNARIGDQSLPDHAVAGNEMQRSGRNAGLVQQRNCACGDERRLFGRFCDHRVAGGERSRHLSEKDREREIPRADADEHAAAAIAEHVALASRPRH